MQKNAEEITKFIEKHIKITQRSNNKTRLKSVNENRENIDNRYKKEIPATLITLFKFHKSSHYHE